MVLHDPISVRVSDIRAPGGASLAYRAQASQRPSPPATGVWDAIQRVLALLVLIFILPSLIVIALAVLAEGGGPIIFTHRRVGRNGSTFGCLKFRTMCVDAEARLAQILATSAVAREEWTREQKLRHDPRVTRVGRFLRATSLDEFPQLINVLRGEMNLVGPRPIVESEIARYGVHFRAYDATKPGITGLWQVSGRNGACYRTRVALDILYARHRSARLDLWILAHTVPAVLLRQGSW